MNNLTEVLDERKAAQCVEQGVALYEQRLKASLEPQFNGQVVAIHLDSGDYAVGRNSSVAGRLLRERHPDGLTVSLDIGQVPVDDPLTRRMQGISSIGSKS